MAGGRVDVHAHYLAPAYIEALHAKDRFLIGGIPIPEWSPKLALGFMDDYGIRQQMLRPAPSGALTG